jgi:hypothetical protein
MANPSDVIKEYLVSLGFTIDISAYNKFTRTLNKVTTEITKHTGEMSKGYVMAGSAIVMTLAAVGASTVKLFSEVAKADLEYQKFAMHMFMSKDAAKDMKIAMDAMGASMEEIAWNPELRKQYNELVRDQQNMRTPADAGKQLKTIRDIEFEFTRLKVSVTKAFEWIAYHLFKHLAGPIKQVKEALKGMNDWLQFNMPAWTSKVAYALHMLIDVGKSVSRLALTILDGLKEIWGILPTWAKYVAGYIVLAMSPFLGWAALISGAILLIDDFYANLDGRKSSKTLSPLWNALLNITSMIKWNMILIAQYWDKISGNDKRSFSQIYADTAADKDKEGEGYREFGKSYGAYGKPGGSIAKDNAPFMTKGFTNSMKYGMDNYNSMAGQSAVVAGGSGQGNTNTKMDIGSINVNVAGTNASPQDITKAVADGVKTAMFKNLAMNTRELAGVH